MELSEETKNWIAEIENYTYTEIIPMNDKYSVATIEGFVSKSNEFTMDTEKIAKFTEREANAKMRELESKGQRPVRLKN